MSTATKCATSTLNMNARSKNWLLGKPSLAEVKKAIGSIVNKVRSGEVAGNQESSDAIDSLTEYFVDMGGDLGDVPSLDDPEHSHKSQGEAVKMELVAVDYGSLCPDTPPAAPLTREEKKDRLALLRSIVRRPEGF